MISNTISLLQKNGWVIIDFSSGNASIRIVDGARNVVQEMDSDREARSFDLIAKKDATTLIIKVSENIDNFSKEKCIELVNLANVFMAVPLIVGTKNRNGLLEDEVLYNRYNINCINFSTFTSVVDRGQHPSIYSMRGGHFVQLKGAEVRGLRQSMNLSLNDVAKELDITSKAVYDYENNNMKTRLGHFEQMARMFKLHVGDFKAEFVETIDLFLNLYKKNYEVIKEVSGFQKEIDDRLVELGFLTYWFNKSPIDMTFEEGGQCHGAAPETGKNVFISEISTVKEAGGQDLKKIIENAERRLGKHVEFLKLFNEIIDNKCNMVVLLDDKLFEEKKHILGIPIIHEHEIPANAEKMKKTILERRKG